ncbi:hypothetical protein GCM10010389_12140 [Streptomyces echinoruber]|uniref:Uncharacterized protein n=1 Tax=Streptomyces echinoruber TaxID=68898 RepID=A0A918R0P5_9ACTN|nr:hypothetical protein GCM10010389_12140 [Streptomyces echinoruber]
MNCLKGWGGCRPAGAVSSDIPGTPQPSFAVRPPVDLRHGLLPVRDDMPGAEDRTNASRSHLTDT